MEEREWAEIWGMAKVSLWVVQLHSCPVVWMKNWRGISRSLERFLSRIV